jgi:hypothetical protein
MKRDIFRPRSELGWALRRTFPCGVAVEIVRWTRGADPEPWVAEVYLNGDYITSFYAATEQAAKSAGTRIGKRMAVRKLRDQGGDGDALES